jgi:hypothetical protein
MSTPINGSDIPILTKEMLTSILAGNEPKRVLIAPDIASVILNNYNRHNRKLYKNTVDAYAKVMENGGWMYTGDPIRFYESSALADGQHRLGAAVQVSYTLDTLVVPKFPDAAIHRIDGAGRKRTASEAFALERVENNDLAAGAVKLILRFVEGLRTTASTVACVTYMAAHKEHLEASINFTLKLIAKYPNCASILVPKEIAAIHYSAIVNRVDRAKIEAFLDEVLLNQEGDSISTRLGNELKDARDKPSRGVTEKQVWASVVECFNWYDKGASTKSIKALDPKRRSDVVVPAWPVHELPLAA